jgi:hypothetical protein
MPVSHSVSVPSHVLNAHVKPHYVPDPADGVDTLLSWNIQFLSPSERQRLEIQRISPGSYIMDGRRVDLRMEPQSIGKPAQVFVRERDVSDGADVPLATYLSQAVNVAGARAIEASPSSDGRSLDSFQNSIHNSRLRSMELACQLAISPRNKDGCQ